MKDFFEGFLGSSKKLVFPALIAVVALSFLYQFLVICVWGNVLDGIFSIIIETGLFAAILVFWILKKEKLVEILFWLYFIYYLMTNFYALPTILGVGGAFGDVLYELFTYLGVLITVAIGVFFVIDKVKGDAKFAEYINCLLICRLCVSVITFVVYFINVFAIKGYSWVGIFNALLEIALVFFFTTYINKEKEGGFPKKEKAVISYRPEENTPTEENK